MNLTPNAVTVLERRYLRRENGQLVETPEGMLRRVAENIAAVEVSHYGQTAEQAAEIADQFYQMMANLDFLPNSPTLMNAGRELQQLAACFVLPVGDSMESIFESLKNAALIHKSGGGTGFSFSRLRPKNDQVQSTGGVASGPISFLRVFNAATDAVKQGGTRRGANMGILRVDHPDIIEFITAKADPNELTNFNLSVGITEKFMQAVKDDSEFDLINPRDGSVVASKRAREVFQLIVEMAWKNGEPGIVFLDRLNRFNPTPKLGEIESTNPCGEQPLLPYEACNLGSLNLAHMVTGDQAPQIDYPRLRQLISLSVRFLDNVIDANHYPLPSIEQMAQGNRKIGLGVMGFADLLIQLGIPYNSEAAVEVARELMAFIDREAKLASATLAEERGVFPNFPGSVYDQPGGLQLRNATVTTIAPTGTISIIAGASSGIEPLFAVCFQRHILDDDRLVEVHPLFERVAKQRGFYSQELMQKIAERGGLHGLEEVPEDIRQLFVVAHDVSPEWHVRIQAAFQEYTDNAVSKTVNFPHEATEEDVARVFQLAFELGCKGVTIYRDGSRQFQVLSTGHSSASGAEEAAAAVQPLGAPAGQSALKPRPRPDETFGITKKYKIGGCGKLYVTVNSDENGVCEVFTNTGEEGCSSLSDAVSRLISLALRAGVDVDAILDQVKGIRCVGCIVDPETWVLSCPDAIGKTIEKVVKGSVKFDLNVAKGPQSLLICPDCGGVVVPQNGCITCSNCGYSKCG
ncbi:MAG: vitamin B12-dependent ribonucleotide reductase [Bacillota bacterium]